MEKALLKQRLMMASVLKQKVILSSGQNKFSFTPIQHRGFELVHYALSTAVYFEEQKTKCQTKCQKNIDVHAAPRRHTGSLRRLPSTTQAIKKIAVAILEARKCSNFKYLNFAARLI